MVSESTDLATNRILVLFLDDSQERAAVAYQRMPVAVREKTIWARTAQEAIHILWEYREQLKLATLDHDLDGEYVNPGNPNSGMEVVRYLERMARLNPTEFENFKQIEFIVHSWNEYAGPKMVERLEKINLKVNLRPFGI